MVLTDVSNIHQLTLNGFSYILRDKILIHYIILHYNGSWLLIFVDFKD